MKKTIWILLFGLVLLGVWGCWTARSKQSDQNSGGKDCSAALCDTLRRLVEQCGGTVSDFECPLDEHEQCGACEAYCIEYYTDPERVSDPCHTVLALTNSDAHSLIESCWWSCQTKHFFANCGLVPSRALCDGIDDCPDGEDEQNDVCIVPKPAFVCSPDTLVLRDVVCDGIDNCNNRADEPCPESYACQPCRCPPSSAGDVCPEAFQCDDETYLSVVVTNSQLLDGKWDCPWGDDETQPDVIACRKQTREEHCEQMREDFTGYRCQDSEIYIPRRDVCNGIEDCPEGDDEPCGKPHTVACPTLDPKVANYIGKGNVCAIERIGDPRWDITYQWRCESGEVIRPSQFCDTVEDCPGGEDETQCPLDCEVTWSSETNYRRECFFPCQDGSWIGQDAVCNGYPNCPGGDDEPCELADCGPDGENPISVTYCDGEAECPDNRDEAGCRHFECRTCNCSDNTDPGTSIATRREELYWFNEVACSLNWPCEPGATVEAFSISRDRVIDGVQDCPAGDDELAPDYFICDDGRQIVTPFAGSYCVYSSEPVFSCRDGSDSTAEICPTVP